MEVFQKTFSVAVDDIAAVCAKIFDYAGINDKKVNNMCQIMSQSSLKLDLD